MKYIRLKDGLYPCGVEDVRKSNPTVSFPAEISDEMAKEFGFAHVNSVKRPTGDVVSETQPSMKDGIYYQAWNVRDFTAEEKQAQVDEAKACALEELDAEYKTCCDKGAEYIYNGTKCHISLSESSLAKLNFLSMSLRAREMESSEDRIYSSEMLNVLSVEGDLLTLSCEQFYTVYQLVFERGQKLDFSYSTARALISGVTDITEIPMPSYMKL